MTRFFGCFAFLLSAILILPAFSAQGKKDEDKPNVKAKFKPKGQVDDPAKDDEDPKKVPKDKKKADPKNKDPELVYGQVIDCKVKKVDGNSNRDFTVEYPVIDQKKVYDLEVWKAQQMGSLSQSMNAIRQAKKIPDYQNALVNYNKALFNYQTELGKRQYNIYSDHDFEVRFAEKGIIRSMKPPVKYDDRGFLVEYNKKDLEKLRAGSKLPGYPVEGEGMEDVKVGQHVKIYMAKGKAGAMANPKGKKDKGIKLKDDDDAPPFRPEAVMIVIQPDPQIAAPR